MFCCSGGHIKQVTGLYQKCQKDSLKFKITFLVSFNNKVLLLVGRKHSHHYTLFPLTEVAPISVGFEMGFSKILDKLQTSKRWISNPFADKICPVISTWRYINKVFLEESSLLQRDRKHTMLKSTSLQLHMHTLNCHKCTSPPSQLIIPSVIGPSTCTQKKYPPSLNMSSPSNVVKWIWFTNCTLWCFEA